MDEFLTVSTLDSSNLENCFIFKELSLELGSTSYLKSWTSKSPALYVSCLKDLLEAKKGWFKVFSFIELFSKCCTKDWSDSSTLVWPKLEQEL